MPLELIKEFVLKKINDTDTKINNIYYKTVPMDKILSDDVSQHILYYSGYHNIKRVNKEWRQLSEKAETNYLT